MLVEREVGGSVADLGPINSHAISQHARSRHFNAVWPVVIIVAQSISEVEDSVLGYAGGVLGDIEVRGLDSTLSGRVRNEEEVELPIDDL